WGPRDTQLTGRIIDRARQNRLAFLHGGTALVHTVISVNAVEAVVAGVKAVDTVHDEAVVLTRSHPRPLGEMTRRIARARGAKEPVLNIPSWVAKAAGSAFERLWDADKRGDEPPITRFLAEQMSTAHWFDQRRTQEALGWKPRITLNEGFQLTGQYYNT